MIPKLSRLRVIAVFAFILSLVVLSALKYGFVSNAETTRQAAMLVPTITATNVDAITTDVDGDGRADPGDTLEYTVTINNAGTDASNLQFNETLDANTTLVGGSVNTSPIAFNNTFPVTGNVSISVPDGASDLLGNDIDPDTGNNTGLTASGGATSAQGGNVVVNANGSFTYNPPPGFEGADTFTYTVTDGSGATNTATVTLNVSAMVWFINNNAAACTTLAAGCGRLSNPFSTLAAFVALNNGAGNNPATNDNIFIFESATAYTGGIGLITGQRLIGQDANATLAAITGITLPSFSTAFPAMNTGAPATTIQGGAGTGVGLNTVVGTNTVRGLSIGTSIPALSGNNFGTLTLDDVSINNNNVAVNLSGGTANTLFDNITSTGGTIGVTLTNVSGATNLGTGAISGATSNGLRIDQGTAVVTYAGTITAPGGARPVEITNRTGGSVTLSGLVSSSGTTFGVLLTGNSSPISFTGGLTLNTGGNPGFTATSNTGVITTTSGTITTGIGTAVNIVGTSAASTTPLNMQLTSVSANGGTNGIILRHTSGSGSPGGFRVLGDGTGRANGSGGTIQNITGAVLGNNPVWLTTVSGNITLTSMNMSITINAYSGMHLDNNLGGTATVNVIGCTFTGVGGAANVTQQKSLLQFEAGNIGANAANVTANVQNSFFFNNRSYGMFATAAGDSIMNVTLNQSGFGTETNTGAPVNNPGTTITNPPPFSLGITNGSNALVDYNVTNNTFWGADSALGAIYAVTISGASTSATSHLNGSFNNNKIGKSGTASSGCAGNCAGLGLLPGTNGTFNAVVNQNDIRQVGAQGINFFNSVTGSTGTAIAHITNNTLAEPVVGFTTFLRAIVVSSGNSGGSTANWCAEVTTNNISGTWQAGFFIRITTNNTTGILTLPGLSPASGATAPQVNSYIQGLNTLAASSVGTTVSGAINGGAACPTPFAPLVEDAENRTISNSIDSLSSLNSAYQSPSEMLASIQPLFKPSITAETVPNTSIVMAKASAEATLEETPETNDTSYLATISTFLSEAADKLGTAMMPTVTAQGTKEQTVNLSGETITVGAPTGFTLPASKSITIKFRATVNNTPVGLTQVSTQGTVSGSNFANVLTDDTAVGGGADPTVTLIDSTTVTVASSQNPSITGQSVTFTATLTGAPVHGVGNPGGTVQFFDNGVAVGAPVAVVAGAVNTSTAQFVTSSLTAGNHPITATYSGGAGFNANNTSNTVNQSVSNTAVWDGSTSAAWADGTNWTTNGAPSLATNDVSIPAAGVTNNPTISAADVTVNNLTLSAGRTLTINTNRTLNINGLLTMNGNNIDASSGVVAFSSSGTVTRTSGSILGNVDKSFTATGAFNYPVGTATGYSPVAVNITALATNPSTLRVLANDGTAPAVPVLVDATTLDRFWSLTETGDLTANVVFNYLTADVDGTETNYKTIRVVGTTATSLPNGTPCPGGGSPCVDAGANTITVNGLQAFSNWTAGELATTAAAVSVSGRVFDSQGRGVFNAEVTMVNSSGNIKMARTNHFGYYRFNDVGAGESYVFSVRHKLYEFAPQIYTINDARDDLDFVASPD